LVPKDHQQKMADGESNGHVTPKGQVVIPIRLESNIAKPLGADDVVYDRR